MRMAPLLLSHGLPEQVHCRPVKEKLPQVCLPRTCCGDPLFNWSSAKMRDRAGPTMDYRNKCGNDIVGGVERTV